MISLSILACSAPSLPSVGSSHALPSTPLEAHDAHDPSGGGNPGTLGGMTIRGCPAKSGGKFVSLTFDDGMSTYSNELLDILLQEGVTASFFVRGKTLEAPFDGWEGNRRALARLVAEGHGVCNHTYHHPFLSPLSEAQVRSEMTRTEQLIADVTGLHTRCMRPPHTDYGQGGKTDDNGNPTPKTDTILKVMRDLDYMVVLVDLEPEDWNYASTDPDYAQNWNPQHVLDTVTAAATSKNTPILHLQHDTKYTEKSIQMVGQVIDIYRQNGWQIISLDECLGQALYR